VAAAAVARQSLWHVECCRWLMGAISVDRFGIRPAFAV